jgi:hypothetical protein
MDAKIKSWLLILGMLWPQSAKAEFSGYIKSLWFETETVVGQSKAVSQGLNRWRLTWREQVHSAQLSLSYDLQWQTGSYLATQQYAQQQALAPKPWWDLQSSWHTKRKESGYHGLYRAFIQIPVGPLDVRIGRQQLNWSQTYLWSSFDRFNPYHPLQLEPDERQGVDGIELVWHQANGNSIEVAAVGARDAAQSSHGIRYRSHWNGIDIDYLLARFAQTTALGIAAAGQWSAAGWRFEATVNRTKDSLVAVGNYQDLIFSVDYTFDGEFTAIGEILYRGDGAEMPSEYDWLALLVGKRTNLARRYVGLRLNKSFAPITTAELTWLRNLDDHSNAFSAAVGYNPGQFDDLHLRVGIHLFDGSHSAEFGRPANVLFAELQWFY